MVQGFLHLVVQECIIEADACGIGGAIAEKDRLAARPVKGGQAHGAGLAACVDFAAIELKLAEDLAGVTNGNDLRVCGGVVGGGDLVGAGCDDLVVFDDEGAKRATAAAAHVFRGERDGLLHELWTAFVQAGGTSARVAGPIAKKTGIISIMVHALASRRVVTPHGERNAAVLIDGERIVAVKPATELPDGVPVEDFGDVALLPGLVDVHTHLNEPGRTEWEGFATGTRAAAAGGFTTIVDMPLNCLPETTDLEALELKRETVRNKAMVDYALWGGAVDENQNELEPLAIEGVAGFKCFLIYPGCDGFTHIDRENLEAAVPHIVRTGLPLLVHAELAGPIDVAVDRLNATGADWRRYATYLASRPDEAEVEAIEMLLELCGEHRFRLHIVHLSTAKALPMLRAARTEGLPVTVETCPHYLHCAAEDIPDGATLFKCAPPIRFAENRESLWAALLDGTIDLIATDHSPCPPAMKRLIANGPGEEPGRFDEAWGGIPSLSTALPVLWTECSRRAIPLAKLAQWTAAAPARLAGLSAQVGGIEPGMHANLVAFDTEASFRLAPEHLHYKHPFSPYMGEELRGVVQATWLRGAEVYRLREGRAVFGETPRGREYGISCSLRRA